MPIKGWVKSLSPQNTFGVPGVNRVPAKSNTIEEISDISSNVKVSRSPDIQIRL